MAGRASTALVPKANVSSTRLEMAAKGEYQTRSRPCIGLTARRCQRLKKECRPSPTVRKRSGRSSASRTAQLEAKLDNLVSLLQMNGSSSGLPADWGSATPQARQNASQGQTGGLASCAVSTGIPSPSSTASSPNNNSIPDACLALQISPETAEKTLSQFRTQNLKFLPFVHIPPHITSQQLRQDKPFLWLCIMCVLAPGIDQREALFSKISALIQQKLLVEVSPSMDVLLGIMTFITW